MQSLNTIKLATILFVFSLISCSAPKNNEKIITEVQAYIQNSQFPEAIIQLKNILQNDPEHSQARYLLGKIYLNQNNYFNAEKELAKAIKINKKLDDAYLLLAKTQLSLNQFSKVVSTLQNKSFKKKNEQLLSLRLIGQAFLRLGDIKNATLKVNEAINISPNSEQTLLGQALIEAFNSNFTSALSITETILKKNPKMLETLLLKASLKSKLKKYNEAAYTYLEYFKLRPLNTGVKTLIAHNFIKAGEYNKAKVYVAELQQLNENNPTVNIMSSQLEYLDQEYSKAKEFADKALQEMDNGLAQMISGLSSYHLKNYEQAYYQLNAIENSLPKDHQVHKVLAMIQLKLGYNQELENNLKNINKLTSDDANFFAHIGLELAQQGNRAASYKMFETALKLAPDDAIIKTNYGLLKISNFDSSGVNDLKGAIKIKPGLEKANIGLAINYLKNNELDKASAIAKRWLLKEPDNISALLLSGNIALQELKPDDATAFFERAAELDTKNAIPLFNLAVIASEQNKLNKSNDILDRLIRINPEYSFAYRLAIQNSIRLNKEHELEVKLQNIIQRDNSAYWPKIIWARRLIIKKEYARAIKVLNEIKTYENAPNAFFETLVPAYIYTNKRDAFADLFDSWQSAQPNNEFAYLYHIKLLEKNRDFKSALAITTRALKQPLLNNNFQLQSLESYFLLANNQIETASKKIAILASQKSNHAFVLRLQGQLALARKKNEKAIRYLSKSMKLNRNTSTGLYLVTAYEKLNKSNEAISFLEKAILTDPQNIIYQKQLARLYAKYMPSKAVKQYKKILEINNGDYIAFNNLAWVLYSNKQFKDALSFSKKAKALAPEHPQILDTYAIILIENNMLKEAIVTLIKANKLASKDSEIALHLAQAYSQNNEKDKALNIVSQFSNEDKEKWKDEILSL